jgi:hypothetical protein
MSATNCGAVFNSSLEGEGECAHLLEVAQDSRLDAHCVELVAEIKADGVDVSGSGAHSGGDKGKGVAGTLNGLQCFDKGGKGGVEG